LGNITWPLKEESFCQGIVCYEKEAVNSKGGIYRIDRCLDLTTNPELIVLVNHIKKILTALKVIYGLTHNEIFWDGKDSYYFIESNNRLVGCGCCEMYQYVYKNDPITSWVESLNSKLLNELVYTRYSHSVVMHLYNVSTDDPTSLNINDIESFCSITGFSSTGKLPKNYRDNYIRSKHTGATVLLKNDSYSKLENDIKLIINRERGGVLFV